MSDAIAKYGDFSPAQINLIKTQLMVDSQGNLATDGELYMFLEICNQRRLDPFKRQIYAVARWSNGRMRWVDQVSIDGLRGMAQRTKERDGTDGPYWCGPDGVWTDIWLSDEPPRAARVTVHRKGHKLPYTAVAQMDFYAQTKKDGTPVKNWGKGGGAHMLGKCAEALAIRQAFPEECGGLYTSDEMEQAKVASALPSPAAMQDVDAAMLPSEYSFRNMTIDELHAAIMDADNAVLDSEDLKDAVRSCANESDMRALMGAWKDRRAALEAS